MDEDDISTAEEVYIYFTEDYKEARPRMYGNFLEFGSKSMIRDWLEEEKIAMSPEEEAKFMRMLDKKLNFFERKNSLSLFF
jgi:hypothetical protein